MRVPCQSCCRSLPCLLESGPALAAGCLPLPLSGTACLPPPFLPPLSRLSALELLARSPRIPPLVSAVGALPAPLSTLPPLPPPFLSGTGFMGPGASKVWTTGSASKVTFLHGGGRKPSSSSSRPGALPGGRRQQRRRSPPRACR